MAKINVCVELSADDLEVNPAKIDVMCEGFFMMCNAFKANVLESATAVALMQDALFDDFGCLPVTPKVVEGVLAIASHEDEADPSELKSTVDDMLSDDYKERFVAEYRQTKIRYDKLDAMTVKYEAGTLDFKPDCPLELLKEQKGFMGNYLRCLKKRAEIEGIDLEG